MAEEQDPENRAAYVKQRNHVNQAKNWARKGMWTKIGNDLQEDVRGTNKLLYSMSKAYTSRNHDKPKNITLKAESGEIITGQNNVSNRWAEYFQNLLNVTDEDNHQERDCGEPTPHLAASTDQDDPIRMDELKSTLKLTKKQGSRTGHDPYINNQGRWTTTEGHATGTIQPCVEHRDSARGMEPIHNLPSLQKQGRSIGM